jgi:hypothetical protein
MAAVTFGDAAAHLGHKSRSSLYRLKREGWLSDYLRPGGKGGADLLELEPEGLPNLREFVKGHLRARPDSPLWAADREARPDPALQRWQVVAAELEASAELAGCPLQLGPAAAEAIATALPEALADGWGLAAVEQLAAEAAGLAQSLRPAPELEQPADGSPPFWAEYGRLAKTDDPPLSDDETEEHAALMVAALQGQGPSDSPEMGQRYWLWDLEQCAADCRRDVAAGARFDWGRWDRGCAAALLADAPECALSAAELKGLLEAGRIPADMSAKVRAAVSADATAQELP